MTDHSASPDLDHRHFVDSDPDVKPCVAVAAFMCLTRTSDGYFIHFDPPHEPGGPRQMGGIRIAPGAWTETGTLEGGDLTISPSIKIDTTVDGREVELLHGWVRDGKWVSA